MKKLKILISTGHGRLHLFQSAEALQKLGLSVSILSGWFPKKTGTLFIKILSILTSHKSLDSGLAKRKINVRRFHSLWYVEFLTQFLLIISKKTKLFSKNFVVTFGWRLFSFCSKFFVKEYNVFHVRSGAGGIALKNAKKINL